LRRSGTIPLHSGYFSHAQNLPYLPFFNTNLDLHTGHSEGLKYFSRSKLSSPPERSFIPLHSGNLAQLKNFPYLPNLITISPPQSGHFSSDLPRITTSSFFMESKATSIPSFSILYSSSITGKYFFLPKAIPSSSSSTCAVYL